jgi:four helix bundle protein
MSHSIALQKSTRFAKRIINLYRCLTKERGEYTLSKQILRSGTSIGANITEAIHGSSRKDFIAKLQIAKKEAAETRYWLELLYSGEYISEKEYKSVVEDCNEILSILVSIIKTSSENS